MKQDSFASVFLAIVKESRTWLEGLGVEKTEQPGGIRGDQVMLGPRLRKGCGTAAVEHENMVRCILGGSCALRVCGPRDVKS